MRAERTRRDLARRIAPHVAAAWTEQLLLELRLRDVQGAAIGAALAEVESHCAESGEPRIGGVRRPGGRRPSGSGARDGRARRAQLGRGDRLTRARAPAQVSRRTGPWQ